MYKILNKLINNKLPIIIILSSIRFVSTKSDNNASTKKLIKLKKNKNFNNKSTLKKVQSSTTKSSKRQVSLKVRNIRTKVVNQESLILGSHSIFKTLLNRTCEIIDFNVDSAVSEIITFHNDLIKNHKVIEGTARYNMIRLYSIMLLEDRNPEPLTRVAVGKKDRWPSAFNELRPLFYRVRDHKCVISDRVIRSILYLNRTCTGNGIPDLTEVLKEFRVSHDFKMRYRNYVQAEVKTASLELITKPSLRVLSNGPNGKPKWLTTEVEAYALMKSELHEPFKALASATGNWDLYIYMESIASKLSRVDRKRLRYITTVRDSGNKCRLVAISDYWTQVLLEPIMRSVQHYAEERFTKVSFSNDHAVGFDNLKKFIRPGIKSYDIKSWTDAFPAELQLEFMEARFGSIIANAWYSLVVSCQWDLKGSKSKIKYNRGQGMGTNGSFDIATVTDLHLLEMIYREDYNMELTSEVANKVGDDLWCLDPENIVLDTYTNECGIEISVSKTKYADDNNLCGEFVSRNINHGQDVSRISANICRAVGKNILDLPQLSSHLHERNWKGILPLREIFVLSKIKNKKHLMRYLRTFVLLSLLKPNPGLKLLIHGIKREFEEEYYGDEFIAILLTFGVNSIKDSFYSYQAMCLYQSIQDKIGAVFDSAHAFESRDTLLQRTKPDKWWINTREGIPMLTSKYLLAKSFSAVNKVFSADDLTRVSEVIAVLEKADQAMTFKRLGVISTSPSKEIWRPLTTKVFNFVSRVKPSSLIMTSSHNSSCEASIDTLNLLLYSGSSNHLIEGHIDVHYNDPIFTGVNRSLIGLSFNENRSSQLTGNG